MSDLALIALVLCILGLAAALVALIFRFLPTDKPRPPGEPAAPQALRAEDRMDSGDDSGEWTVPMRREG